MSRLMRLPLTLTRVSGKWQTGRWISGTPELIEILGSIQPVNNSEDRQMLPEGIKSNDAQMVYSFSAIKTADQFSEEEADTTIIDGQVYVASVSKNWSRRPSRTAHYQVLFVRKDKGV